VWDYGSIESHLRLRSIFFLKLAWFLTAAPAGSNATSGSIHHLGNPGQNAAASGAYTAYELLSDECHTQDPEVFLEFGEPHRPSLKELLIWLLKVSPVRRLLFTSDY
jgi:hypothetical protein